MTTIYLDMDGVVADFNGYAESVLGFSITEERWEEHQWLRLIENQRIYRDLKKTKEADTLVEFCRNLAQSKNWKLRFLTAVPKKNDVAWAFYDKINWASLYFSDIPVFFGPYSKDKWQHCIKGDILIDDRTSNIHEWTAAGGIGILHKGNLENTLSYLNRLK